MSAKLVAGGLVAVVMLVGGGFLALAGMGYVGASARTSSSWVVIGALLAGFGVALVVVLVQRRR